MPKNMSDQKSLRWIGQEYPPCKHWINSHPNHQNFLSNGYKMTPINVSMCITKLVSNHTLPGNECCSEIQCVMLTFLWEFNTWSKFSSIYALSFFVGSALKQIIWLIANSWSYLVNMFFFKVSIFKDLIYKKKLIRLFFVIKQNFRKLVWNMLCIYA